MALFRSGAALCLRSFCKYDNLTVKLKNGFQNNAIKNTNSYRLRYYSQNDVKPPLEDIKNVYVGTLTSQIRGVKVFSLASSVMGLVAQPILYLKASTFGSMPVIIVVGSVIGFFTFVTPLLLHLITKKYVINMDYNEKTETYTATTLSFFVIKKKLDFKLEDVDVPELPGMFTSIIAKGKPLFIEMKQFTHPEHYGKIMGYDKPIDFKFSPITVPTNDSNEKSEHK